MVKEERRMTVEVGPAKFIYAVDEPVVAAPKMEEELMGPLSPEIETRRTAPVLNDEPMGAPSPDVVVGPAKLRYATEDVPTKSVPDEEMAGFRTASDQTEGPAGKMDNNPAKKIPTPRYSLKPPKRAQKIMSKRVFLKVEDLLREGRSHFEIPKSKQEAMKAQKNK
jgi:hypothetical protein